METQVVVLQLANEHYGVDIAAIEGIIKMRAITRMPLAPGYVEGITTLRGNILPVIDLRKPFGLKQQPVSCDTRIVVAYVEENKVGLIVDAVSQVMRVSDGDIEPPPPIATTIHSAFIRGIVKIGGQLVILLDLDKVLNATEKESLAAGA